MILATFDALLYLSPQKITARLQRRRGGKPFRPLRPDSNIVIDLTPAVFREMVGNLGPGKVRVTVKVI